MPSPKDLGKQGEQIAADYLLAEGYEILERNWRHRRAEIDLILRQGEILVFVEVKTRSKDPWNSAERSINAHKKALLSNAASAYMELIGHEWEIRFDVLIILCPENAPNKITHYKDAFFSDW